MFEDSLMESGGKIKTKSKYWVWVGLGINFGIIGAMILYPLIYPDALPVTAMTTLLVAPPPPPPPPPQPVHVEKIVSQLMNNQLTVPKIPHEIKMVHEAAPPPPAMAGVAGMEGMGSGSANGVMGGILGGMGTGGPTVKAAPPKRIAV